MASRIEVIIDEIRDDDELTWAGRDKLMLLAVRAVLKEAKKLVSTDDSADGESLLQRIEQHLFAEQPADEQR